MVTALPARRPTLAFGASGAVHACALFVLVSLPVAPAVPAKPTSSTVVAYVAPPEDAANRGLNPVDPATVDAIQSDTDAPAFSLRGYRVDVAKISSRPTLLFPFLTPGLALDTFARGADRPPFDRWPIDAMVSSGNPHRSLRPALAISDTTLQQLVDRSWSRRERWASFQPIVGYLAQYDADAGRLSTLLRAYAEQDGLQVFSDAEVRDPRLWTQLGLAADHVKFIGTVREYVSQHPGTRTAIELLFLLDDLVQGSLDAFLTLMATDPAEQLRATHDAAPQAYDLLIRVRRYYGDTLRRLHLDSVEAITRRFEQVRLDVMSLIVRTAPDRYRVGDAKFLAGAILWRQHRAQEAMGIWRTIRVDATDRYATAYGQILDALAVAGSSTPTGATDDPAHVRRIDQILASERGRWVSNSYERLKHFGYRFNTF